MQNSSMLKITLVGLLALFTSGAIAENKAAKAAAGSKVSYRSLNGALESATVSVPDSSEIIFSAAPREEAEEAKRLYGPVAEYLSQATGKKIVYKHAGNWGVYQGTMQRGGYDLVFDGPHFNGWRITKLQHNTLVKVPGDHTFVALVKKDNTRIQELKQLAGYTVCAHAPPNLGTLTLLSQFENPSRQPVIINTDGWKNIYAGLMEGKCAAAMVPIAKLEQFEKNGAMTRIIYRAKALPDNAISAGPRLTTTDQAKIAQALLAPEAAGPTQAMRQKYAADKALIPATNDEYANLGEYLRNEWGYY